LAARHLTQIYRIGVAPGHLECLHVRTSGGSTVYPTGTPTALGAKPTKPKPLNPPSHPYTYREGENGCRAAGFNAQGARKVPTPAGAKSGNRARKRLPERARRRSRNDTQADFAMTEKSEVTGKG